MTRTDRQQGDRALAFETYPIQVAAAAEALALGHPEVDVEHLLLGLVVVGGPSARALTGAGIDLDALRRAQAQVAGQDLAALGITAPAQRAVLHAGQRSAALAVPVGGRARDLLDAAPFRGDDRALLLALLDDEGRRARRLLEHLGIDVEVLRERLGGEHAPAPAARDRDGRDGQLGHAFAALRGPAPAGGFWIEASWSQELPVPAERVWALVGDPARRAEWDPDVTAVAVTAEGVEQLTLRSGRATTQRVVQLEPGRAVAWRRRGAGTAEVPAEATEQVLQVVLEPVGATTRVHLRLSSPGRGRGVRLSRPLLARMVRTRLRVQADVIAQAA